MHNYGFNTASGKYCCNKAKLSFPTLRTKVSIPQAVSTVATSQICLRIILPTVRFNTASGKYCCNLSALRNVYINEGLVSIPQAVSTVATSNC